MGSEGQTKREAQRAEQRKVVPGDGFLASMDRGAWGMGGGKRAGEWSWVPALAPLLPLTLVWLLLGFSLPGLVGAVAAVSLLAVRGHGLNRRYLERGGG